MAIVHIQGYIGGDPCLRTCEKEHVLVALRMVIAERPGVLLLDPGYHVARVVTVMNDAAYPHTGPFVQCEEPGLRKEYSYSLTENPDYVAWTERVNRDDVEKISDSAVYIAKPYLTPINVTERRNLVYNFRSWLVRDTKGNVPAGFYLKLEEGAKITIVYQDSINGKQRLHIDPYEGLDPGREMTSALKHCSKHFGMTLEDFEGVLQRVITILKDAAFLQELLAVNASIAGMSTPN